MVLTYGTRFLSLFWSALLCSGAVPHEFCVTAFAMDEGRLGAPGQYRSRASTQQTGEIVEAMARVSMPSRVSMTTPVWPRVQSCVRSVAGVIVAKAGISGCNFADRTNGGRLTRDDQAYSRDGSRRIALEGLTGSRMCVCPDVAPTRRGWSLILSRRIFVVMVSGIGGLRCHFEKELQH